MKEFAFPVSQRLKSQKAIDRLFCKERQDGKTKTGFLCYPLRIVAMDAATRPDGYEGPKILVSIPKKKIRKAVGRVLLRRRIREAWRLNADRLDLGRIDVAFIYVADEPLGFNKIKTSVDCLISRLIAEVRCFKAR